jgi:UDP-N-acetylglucosamine 2-epimerase (non-hydrolysing)
MKKRLKTLFVIGTRPEAIKLAPVVLAMRRDPRFLPVVCVTGQHREMLEGMLPLFRIRPRHVLDTMAADQALASSMSAILSGLERVIREETPGLVVVQGDTTSTLAGTLAAVYNRIPVAHVEAGLRTHDKRRPFPEEINRRLSSHAADFHFAPTPGARDNLLAEGIQARRIAVTGNTGVDALLHVKAYLDSSAERRAKIRRRYPFAESGRTMILVTGHRRESIGEGFRNICGALRRIALAHPSVDLVYPVHLNPEVRKPVIEGLSGIPNVILLSPVDYEAFVYLMTRARLILTDSGGIQEEAPSLGKPVLVMRDATERPEALAAGCARLVGTDPHTIVKGVERVLAGGLPGERPTPRRNPYGDGRTSERILRLLGKWLAR